MLTETPDLVNVDVTASRSDVYEWRACYENYDPENAATFLDEYDETGIARGWRHIDQSRLTALILLPQRDGLGTHVLKVTGEARPIFFRRRVRELNGLTFEQETATTTATVLGWQRTVQGVNVATLTVFYGDGSTLVTNDPQGF